MEATLISRFLKGVIATGLGTVVTLVLGFLNIGIAARYVPKEDFGIFLLIQTIVFSVVMTGDLGLNVSTTKFLAASEDAERAAIVSTAITLRAVVLGVAIAIVLGCRSGISHIFDSGAISALYFYIPILVVMESYNSMFSSILQGLQRYRKLALGQIIASMTNVALIAVTVLLLHCTLHGLFLSRLAALLISSWYQISSMGIKFRLNPDWNIAKALLNFGLFLGINNVLSFIFGRIDTLIIGAIINPVGVALYGTASKIPDASRQLFDSFRSVFFPNMAELYHRQKKEDAEQILNNSLRLISFLSLLLALNVLAFGSDIVTLFFSYRYASCGPILSLLMIAMCIGLVGNMLGTSLVAAGYPKLPALINIVDATVCVAANLTLIPKFGIMGAAYAAIIARVATTPVNIYFLRRNNIGMKVSNFVKPFVVFAGCWALLQVKSGALYSIGVVLLYLLLCACWFVVTKHDLSRVKNIFSSVSSQPT